ncbi:MAG: helix-turn-helix domain-containing protein [Clostridia bacterium]|nr:helix-turn-helix domain-containing protein [Clostridia bacterium]
MGRKAVTVMPQTQQLLSQMGEQIRMARLRRRLSSELVAERAGVSRATVSAVEHGNPSVAIGAYAAVLHALGEMEKDLLLIAADDELGRKLQDLGLPERIRAPRRHTGKGF